MVLFKLIDEGKNPSGYIYLHSNMVLFKLSHLQSYLDIYLIYIPIWFYSNGISFNLNLLPFLYLHSNMVLFKYVAENSADRERLIYIPIWFYSNH